MRSHRRPVGGSPSRCQVFDGTDGNDRETPTDDPAENAAADSYDAHGLAILCSGEA